MLRPRFPLVFAAAPLLIAGPATPTHTADTGAASAYEARVVSVTTATRFEIAARRLAGPAYACTELRRDKRRVSVRVTTRAAATAIRALVREQAAESFVDVARVDARYARSTIVRIKRLAQREIGMMTSGAIDVGFRRSGVPSHRCPGVAIYALATADEDALARARRVQDRFGVDRVRLYFDQDALAD